MVDVPSSNVESNFAEFLLGMGRAGGGVERSDAEITWTVGGSPIDYHNAVVRCRAPEARAAGLVNDWRSELLGRSLPGSWHLTPSMRPSRLPHLLQNAGFRDGGDEPAMAAALPALIEPPPRRELAITRVTDAPDLGAFRHVLAEGFGEGPTEADWVVAVNATMGLSHDGPWHHFIGRVDDDPVATATLLLTGEAGGIYFVCTRPDARRRGYGAAITHSAMTYAADRGAAVAVLGSSPMGQSVYQRLGFRTVFSTRLFEFTP